MSHLGWVFMLKDVSTIGYPFGTSLHCFFRHTQHFHVCLCLWPTRNYYWYWGTLDHICKRVDITSIQCLYNIGATFGSYSRNMRYYVGIVRILDLLASWIHHCKKWHAPFVTVICNSS